jgi:hypothetical protein
MIPWISTAIRGERLRMGRRERGQGQFFYAFDLDKVVPTDHLVRQIDGVLDLDWVHRSLRAITRIRVGLRSIRC